MRNPRDALDGKEKETKPTFSGSTNQMIAAAALHFSNLVKASFLYVCMNVCVLV